MYISFFYLAAYLIILAYITWRSARKQTVGDYLNSSKNLSAWESSWTTFASLLTGYNFVLGTTFAYLYGFWYLMAFAGAGLAFVVLYFFFKRHLSQIQKKYNLFSIGDYFGLDYGLFAKIFVNVILGAGLFLFLVLQIFVNTQLFASLLSVKKELALLFTTGIVCLYLWIGGFKASVKTDIFQGILMLPIILVIFFTPSHFSLEKIPAAFDPSLLAFGIGLAILQFLSLLAQPESFQRIFASRDARSLKKGLITAFLLILLVAGSVAYLGINFRFAGINVDPSNLFVGGVLNILPRWLGPLLIISLIAAFMGTIDSSAFALGTLLARASGNSAGSIIARTRYFMLAGIIASSVGSLYLFSFLSSVFALISLISIVGTALLIVVLLKPAKTEINAFLVIGSVTYVLGLIFGFVTENPLTSLIPSAAGLAAFGILFLSRKLK